jgi:predicted transposase YbfD/YdcC
MSQTFLDCIRTIPDHRIVGLVDYPLDEILFATLVLCGADDFDDVESIGSELLDWLRGFLPYENGVASGQTFRRFFRLVDPKALEAAFAAWMASFGLVIRGVVAIDGKTLRGSKPDDPTARALHLVSAYACELGLVLGQKPVEAKSNEITAIPELLDMLALKGMIVTIDAMGAQSGIAAKIIDKKADYILALKGNQGSLHDDVRRFFTDAALPKANQFQAAPDLEHGRIEERCCTVHDDIDWLRQRHPHWQGLRSIVEVKAMRTDKKSGDTSTETRYYISSLEPEAEVILNAVRAHWRIENNLHWQLDVTFNEDQCRMRKDYAALSFAIIRRFAFNMLKREPSKAPIKRKRLKALMNQTFRENLIAS